MGRILIGEPHPEIRELLIHVVDGLGFESVPMSQVGGAPDFDQIDALLLEPGDRESKMVASRLRAKDPDLPIVCVSIYPPHADDLHQLDPVAYLVKPFSITALQSALVDAAAVTSRGTQRSSSGSL